MATTVIQVRLPKGIVNEINNLVNSGLYTSKSDVIRDGIRKLIVEHHIGSIENSKNSVKEVRNIRKILSKKKIDIKDFNLM